MPIKRLKHVTGALALTGLLFVSPTSSAEKQWDWYWNVGYGASHVDPEGKVRGWSTDDNSDTGYKVGIGADINPQWGVEIAFHDLGMAGLGNDDPAIDQQFPGAGIDYKVISGMFNYSPWHENQDDYRLYGKFGISNIRNEASEQTRDPNDLASPPFDEETAFQFAVGVGFRWNLSEDVFLKTEFERFDRDASFLSLQIGAYF